VQLYVRSALFATLYHNYAPIHFIHRQLTVTHALDYANSIDIFRQQVIYHCACILQGCYDNYEHW
jgi:hypothetical protein